MNPINQLENIQQPEPDRGECLTDSRNVLDVYAEVVGNMPPRPRRPEVPLDYPRPRPPSRPRPE